MSSKELSTYRVNDQRVNTSSSTYENSDSTFNYEMIYRNQFHQWCFTRTSNPTETMSSCYSIPGFSIYQSRNSNCGDSKSHMYCIYQGTWADSRLAPSQWETLLQSNTVSHWLGASLESALWYMGSLQAIFHFFPIAEIWQSYDCLTSTMDFIS